MSAVTHVKIVVVGDGAVGKTCLLCSYTQDTFSIDYVPTVFDNYSALSKIDGRVINLGLWDTAGQDDYDRLRPLSYPQTDCFLLCYSVISPASLDNISTKWYPELKHHCPNVPLVLVGTKKDLFTDPAVTQRLAERGAKPVSFEDANAVAKSIGAYKHLQVSSLTRDGVDAAFTECVRAVFQPKKAVRKQKKCQLF